MERYFVDIDGPVPLGDPHKVSWYAYQEHGGSLDKGEFYSLVALHVPGYNQDDMNAAFHELLQLVGGLADEDQITRFAELMKTYPDKPNTWWLAESALTLGRW